MRPSSPAAYGLIWHFSTASCHRQTSGQTLKPHTSRSLSRINISASSDKDGAYPCMLVAKPPVHMIFVTPAHNDHTVVCLRRANGPANGLPPILYHIPPISAQHKNALVKGSQDVPCAETWVLPSSICPVGVDTSCESHRPESESSSREG